MTKLEERLGLSGSALAILPVLLLPMVIGASLLLFVPSLGMGRVAIVFSTVAFAWYLLGGAISVAHGLRRFAVRRTLHAIRGEVSAAPEPIWICDDDGQVIFQNAASRDRFGDISGQPMLVIFQRLRADAENEMNDLLRRAMATGGAELDLQNGDTIALSAASDAPLRVWSYHGPEDAIAPIDIALAADDENQSDAEMLAALPVALLQIGRDGRIWHANNAACRLLGKDLGNQLIATHLGSFLDGPGRSLRDWIDDVSAGRIEGRPEVLRLRTPKMTPGASRASERYFQVSLATFPGDSSRLIAVLNDASAMKTLEAQFVQSQKMQAIGQLAGGVAHDFNNLLTAISGHCDLLMLRYENDHPDYADLDQISQNANRAAALVGQLLAFSRKQTLHMETLDVRDTLADLTHLLNRLVGERVRLTINHDPTLHPVRADKRQLEQVIMNLVVNARDAMPAGGDVSIDTDLVQIRQPLMKDRVELPPGQYVRIRVSDEGCGIAPENLEKIFEPFFTTKRTGEGTGLGLSTVYGIVKQTGGYIFCDSQPGSGTSFSLYFPALTQAPDVMENGATNAPAAQVASQTESKAKVLLVEDEAPVRAFAARALGLKGYEVIEADSAEAALTILKDHSLHVDIFVTDVVMPGMDGPTWVRQALQDRPGTRVVFMSGYTEDIFGEDHEPLENSVFLVKPFTLAELNETVRAQLAQPRRVVRRH
ncbi:ATP-binding protein [Paracoccus sp. Z330]|uniref:histidine kinase n=1 Tax=Paracoccus onchidii TaxID=3017813 RepID=A0ABT4ZAP3_9RHOB|nr:ATP-binding protein [Paracoccus onchidii]MDB6176018.1 ATP-binding protein [Paracoccus onchidii]